MQALWFFNTLVHLWVSEMEGQDGLSVLEHQAPPGDSPPLHVHHTEDEVFVVLEGELRLQVGDTSRRARPFDVLLAPKGVSHTYRVESLGGARWLTFTAHRDSERFVRAMSRPAEREELPPPLGLAHARGPGARGEDGPALRHRVRGAAFGLGGGR